MLTLLDDRALLAVTGTEARAFLQGLITNDVEKLTPQNALYAALLTPQGKILFDFLLVEGDGAILIDCARTSQEGLQKRFNMYKLRSNVTIEPRGQLAAVASTLAISRPGFVSYVDPRNAGLGHRGIGAKAEVPLGTPLTETYVVSRLKLGVPEGGDFGSERIFALDAGLEELHAVDFHKGCYVGQELTARMKHRGAARKRLLPIECLRAESLPQRGTAVMAADREIGEITSTYGPKGFALIRLDHLDSTGAQSITAGQVAIRIDKPSWLFP